MDAAPIVLPPPADPPRRASPPFLAALVPVVAGVLLWAISGSAFALCFALLGPLMLGASLLDGVRSRRREHRRARAEEAGAWEQAELELGRRHVEERGRLRLLHPDAASALAQRPLRGAQSPNAETAVVLGGGSVPSAVHSTGGDGERARAFRARCRILDDAPVAVPLGGGVCLRGPAPVVHAAARALVTQLCLRFGPAQLAVVGAMREDCGVADFPHARAVSPGAFRVAVTGAPRAGGDAFILLADERTEVPEGITTVLDVVEPRRGILRTPTGTVGVDVECLSRAQSTAIARSVPDVPGEEGILSGPLGLGALVQPETGAGLAAAIGRAEQGEIVLDIVEDGPHAIVTGTTGTGKSELLVSWVTAMATAHGPDRVVFVLADFKGGTAFEPLRGLPQVAAVITDLDGAEARRGVSSLTAELRRREAALAAAGVRDVGDVDMPRLVVVVDEFAALLHEHGELGAVFTDVAARGRALGMHLILGTQRAAGVVREALAANCPLRISLRVGDPADSRLVIGTEAAAGLPGGPAARGLALLRRAQDTEPRLFRVALTGTAEFRAASGRWPGAEPPRSPWMPPLPPLLPLSGLVTADQDEGLVVLGRGDAPERQEQPCEVLRIGDDRGLAVLGVPGSGRTTLVRSLLVQRPDGFSVPRDPEGAWDAVEALAARGPRPSLVVCDDIDALLGELPAEHAQQFARRWEQIIGSGHGMTIVLTAARANGAVSRLLDALPLRILLQMPNRAEHLAAGGESVTFGRDRPPGRGVIGDREVQLAWTEEGEPRPAESRPRAAARSRRTWVPRAPLTGIVSPAAEPLLASLRRAYPQCEVLAAGQEPTTDRPLVMVGEAESWQRVWALWQRIRAEGEVLVRAENPADLRQLAGIRDLPPFARAHAGRAWSVRGTAPVCRVIVPTLAPR